MRWMLGILIIANLSLFIWGRTVGNRGVLSDQRIPENIGSIELIDGNDSALADDAPIVPDQAAPEHIVFPDPDSLPVDMSAGQDTIETVEVVAVQAPLSVVEVVAETAMLCGIVGPLDDPIDAGKLKEALQALRLEVIVAEVEQAEAAGYWVLLPVASDTDTAKTNETELIAAGINDLWRFRKGELKNAISLGFYDRKQSAEVRAKGIEAQGFAVTIQPKLRTRVKYQLRYQGESEPGLQEALDDLLQKYPERKHCR